MSESRLPLILEPEALESHLGEPGLLIVDLSRAETHQRYHLPGAVFLDYGQIVAADKPVMGLLPDAEHLSRLFSALGLTPETHVVAYDDEGGGKAARLLWTLEVVGHPRYSLLNGGLHAWAGEDHPLTAEPTPAPQPSDYKVTQMHDEPVADRQFILEHLKDPEVAILDARSPEEYLGEKRYAERGGHIPGAVNLEWTEGMDQERNLRLKPAAELERMLSERGVTPDKTVVVHCQTHHRSALSYIMLRALNYPRVKGYAGSWSEWGNRSDTPIE